MAALLTRARLWLRSALLRRRLEREMVEEMAAHLERATERLVARGLAPEEARRQARLEFGNLTALQEQGRDARGAGWVEALLADARFASRHFARTPFTTLTMFVVLVVGISLSALLLSAVYSLATQPPSGVARADDLVRIRGVRGRNGENYRAFEAEEFREYRALNGPFRAVAGWTQARHPLVLPTDPERRPLDASVTFVTENYFPVLNLRLALGPGLPAVEDTDDRMAAVAVISFTTWKDTFGQDTGVIGSTVFVGGVPVRIVGVAPARFHGISFAADPIQLWMPLVAQRDLLPDPGTIYTAAARLRSGTSLASATAVVRPVAGRTITSDSLRVQLPSADVVPLLAMNGDPEFDHSMWQVYLLVGLLSVLVLLVTCTNTSALLMGLAMARRQEIAIRLALGAARTRILRQLLTESMLLSGIAGATALGVVWLSLRVATQRMPWLPFELRMTTVSMTFTFGVALAVGVLFGLAPALHGTRVALAGALSDSAGQVAGRRGGLQKSLVVAQIAFTQPLIALLATVLLVVLAELQPRRLTQFGDRVIRVTVQPKVRDFDASSAADRARRELQAAMVRVTRRLGATPGVEVAVLEWRAESPLGVYSTHPADQVPDAPPTVVRLAGERAASGYFAAMGIPIKRGQDFAPNDVVLSTAQPSDAGIIIGTDLARRVWASADPIGRRLQIANDSVRGGARTLTVVGVIDDPMAQTRKADRGFRVYLPPDTTRAAASMLFRTASAAGPLLPVVRTAVYEETGDTRAEVRTLTEIEDETQHNRRVAASAISAAGLMALLISALGLYAVVAFSVKQRTREIAVRVALGAQTGQIVRRIVADGVRLGAIGLLLGLPFSLLGLRTLLAANSDFPAVPVAPVAVIAALGVIGTAILAAWLPARRAARVDPAVALRAE